MWVLDAHDRLGSHWLMDVACKRCRHPIPAEDVNLERMVAKCRACQAVFAFVVERAAGAAGARTPFREAAAVADMRRRPPVPLPSQLVRVEASEVLSIRRRWFKPDALFQLFFCIAWDAFLVVWYTAALGGGSHWLMIVFPVAHVAVGVTLTYSTLAKLFNSTVVSAGGGRLRVRHGPIPWRGNHDLPSTDIVQVYCRVSPPKSNSSELGFDVVVVLRDDRSMTLVAGLPALDQALFIEQEIEHFLSIRDVPVPGEVEVA